jgi:hypothetical protein
MVSRYGHIYERQAIVEWITSGNEYCPLTRQSMSLTDIIQHRSLQKSITAWCIMNRIIPPGSTLSFLSSSSSKAPYELMKQDSLVELFTVTKLSRIRQLQSQSDYLDTNNETHINSLLNQSTLENSNDRLISREATTSLSSSSAEPSSSIMFTQHKFLTQLVDEAVKGWEEIMMMDKAKHKI